MPASGNGIWFRCVEYLHPAQASVHVVSLGMVDKMVYRADVSEIVHHVDGECGLITGHIPGAFVAVIRLFDFISGIEGLCPCVVDVQFVIVQSLLGDRHFSRRAVRGGQRDFRRVHRFRRGGVYVYRQCVAGISDFIPGVFRRLGGLYAGQVCGHGHGLFAAFRLEEKRALVGRELRACLGNGYLFGQVVCRYGDPACPCGCVGGGVGVDGHGNHTVGKIRPAPTVGRSHTDGSLDIAGADIHCLRFASVDVEREGAAAHTEHGLSGSVQLNFIKVWIISYLRSGRN